jgi:hypothetical protein
MRFWLAAASLMVVGCGDAEIGAQNDYVVDSFAKPTEHGELLFGLKNSATFDAHNRFHAWTFELSGDAKVDLRTTPAAQNLDTLIYLYKRGSNGKWGSYISVNDDHNGNLWSRIQKSLKAGEYQLKVKAHKVQATGAFDVEASCTGAGCPVVEACSDEPLPAATSFSAGCAAKVESILLGPVDVATETTVQFSERCSLAPLAARAAGFYARYWEDLGIWSDMLEYGDGDAALEVTVWEHGTGTTVRVDGDGDEDLLSFVFDADGELVAYHHDEQSPSVEWFCAAAGEPAIESPEAECVGTAIGSLAHDGDATTSASGSATPEEADYESSLLALAANHFVLARGLEPDATLEHSYEKWESLGGWGEAAQVTLTHGAITASYTATTGYDDPQLLTLSEGSAVQFLCQR